ncbi:trypsin-like serine protease [Micromonospora sp. SL1-18]|uniref:trypsin-like serine protease n=1 Tax=Micromonospora sp. SL1-18 TaxID=3399128 RepID=UPI003A4DDCAF
MAEAVGGTGRAPWRVRIRNTEGEVLGAGIIVSPCQVLTCAHVLAEPTDPLGCPRHATFVVDVVGPPGPSVVNARVMPDSWLPPTDDKHGDLALLELDRQVPDDQVAALRLLPDWWPEGKAYGYPEDFPDGLWVDVRLIGWDSDERVQLVQKDQPHLRVAPGFSGAGVCAPPDDPAYVVSVALDEHGKSVGASWMVPMDTVVRRLPMLADRVRPWPPGTVDVARLIQDYLAGHLPMPVIVVLTGAADSPASRVLSGSDPRDRPGDGQPAGSDGNVRIDASGKTAEEVAVQVASALGLDAEGARALSDYQGSMSGKRVILEDIDGAADPDLVVSEVVTPLVRRNGRVVAAFRWAAPPSAVALGVETLATLVDEIGEAERAAQVRQRRVAARIAGVPEVPSQAAELRQRLADLRAAADGRQVVAAVAAAAGDAERARQVIRDVVARLDESLARRDELRGRLEAYRAMAAAGELVEDIDLSELYGAARGPLWRGRCDLAVAAEAVTRYVRAVHEKLNHRGAS